MNMYIAVAKNARKGYEIVDTAPTWSTRGSARADGPWRPRARPERYPTPRAPPNSACCRRSSWRLLAALVATPFLLSERPELITLVTNVVILSLLALSFDLCWGYAGIMSFGQAVFFGIAGYGVALVGARPGVHASSGSYCRWPC